MDYRLPRFVDQAIKVAAELRRAVEGESMLWVPPFLEASHSWMWSLHGQGWSVQVSEMRWGRDKVPWHAYDTLGAKTGTMSGFLVLYRFWTQCGVGDAAYWPGEGDGGGHCRPDCDEVIKAAVEKYGYDSGHHEREPRLGVWTKGRKP